MTRLHLTVNYIDTLMEKGRKTRNWNPAVQEVKAFLAEGSLRRLHPVVLTKAIRLFALAGLIDDSIGILRNAQASGYKKINVLHYNAAMTACRNHKRYTSGLELFDEMPLEPDLVSKSLAIHMLGRVGSWEKALRLYRSVEESAHDEALLMEIMSCLTRNNQAGKSLELYILARKDNIIEPSAALYTAAVIALIEMEDYDQMDTIYEEAKLRFPEDSILKFNWERGTRRKNGEVENHQSASHERKKMSTNFKELLRLAASSGDYRYAVREATAWMERGRFTNGGVTSALKLFGNANRGDKLDALLGLLAEKGFVMNLHHQNACMAAFIRCHQPDKALKIFDGIEFPDSYSYSSALQAWTKLDVEGALAFFLNKIPLEQKGAVHYNTVMSCVGKGKDGDWRRALDIYFELSERGLADAISHRIIINTLETREQLVLASQIKKDLATSSSNGACVTSENFEGFVVSVEDGPEVTLVENIEDQQRLADQGLLPELSQAGTLLAKLSERPEQGSALVHFLAVAERIGDVDSVIGSMEERMQQGEKNVRFHLANTYNAAILACGVLGEESRALSYFDRMRRHEVPRNEATYTALLNILSHWDDEAKKAEIRGLAVEDGIFVLTPG